MQYKCSANYIKQNREMSIIDGTLPRVDKAFMPCPKGHKSPFYPCIMSFWRKVTTVFTGKYSVNTIIISLYSLVVNTFMDIL
jgi:hypothetical protein